MNYEDVRIEFRHRNGKPSNPREGYFYWIEIEGGKDQIWFSPSTDSKDMILLSTEVSEEIISRISNVEGDVNEIKSFLDNISDRLLGVDSDIESLQERIGYIEDELSSFIKEEDLEGYATKEDLDNIDVELTDSDYDIIAEKVNESFKLTWKVI